MIILKCKMCGGNLELSEGVSVCECEYCGTRQTVPSADSEKKLALFARANRLRAACEFDKAFGVYESIVAEFPEEAEAYWGLILCKYGIEYVDDPMSGKKVPTCHRSSFESVLEDSDFELVMENADPVSRAVYREEAKFIEELRIRINEVSSKEEPYDIFICYKETADDGQRTLDSVLAQDLYDALTARGYKVFFSRITLEDKLGQEYEPYIFAALNSAKIMLAVGTDYEHYNAVWVKNEWSRFLHLIAKGEQKTLIPCYKDIDAYDMPAEFKRLQAQDLGKVGATQDLLRGIEKIIGTKAQNGGATASSMGGLIKRGYLYLEDKDFIKAGEYFEKALDDNPEDGNAYLGAVLAKVRLQSSDALGQCPLPLETIAYFVKALRFSNGAQQARLQSLLEENRRQVRENHAVVAEVVNGSIGAQLESAPRLLPLLEVLSDSDYELALGVGKADVLAALLPYDIVQAVNNGDQPLSLDELIKSNIRLGSASNSALKQALIELNRNGYVAVKDRRLVCLDAHMTEQQKRAALTDLQAKLEAAILADSAEAEQRKQALIEEKQVLITKFRSEMLRLSPLQQQQEGRFAAVQGSYNQLLNQKNVIEKELRFLPFSQQQRKRELQVQWSRLNEQFASVEKAYFAQKVALEQLNQQFAAVKKELTAAATEANTIASGKTFFVESDRVQLLRARIESLEKTGCSDHNAAYIDPSAIEALFETVVPNDFRVGNEKEAFATADPEQYIRTHFTANNKLAAIKCYRELTGVGLREAKDVIDRLL